MEKGYDIVVVGGGAAGLSAATVLARAQADVLVVDSGEPRNAPAKHMHGFLSREGMPPPELLRIAREDVIRYGARIVHTRVSSAEIIRETGDEQSFMFRLADNSVLESRAVLVAAGLVDIVPEIPGVRELWGSDVHHCPHCHGYEVRGSRIAVIGGDNRALSVHQAGLLRRYSADVQFFPRAIELTAEERRQLTSFGVEVIDGDVSALRVKDGRLSGVVHGDGSLSARDAVFVGPIPKPRDDLLRMLGCERHEATGFIRVDSSGATSVPGVWAAGNVVNSRAQVITAAGEGSAVGIAITGWLLEKDLRS